MARSGSKTFWTCVDDYTGMKYSREHVIGRGSFSTVHLGRCWKRNVAVKKVQLDMSPNDEREIELQKKLNHMNVLSILLAIKDDDFRYIVLELCAGTLGDVIEGKYQGPELKSDFEIFYQIADGLDHIHSNNLIHRDIKPDNILISREGDVKLSDFGLSKQVSEQGTCSISGLKGTLLWMAPEMRSTISKQERGRATTASDVFPCGCVYFVFHFRNVNGGIHPFGDRKNHHQITFNIFHGNPVNLNMLHPGCIEFALIEPMIRHEPRHRATPAQVKEVIMKYFRNVRQHRQNSWPPQHNGGMYGAGPSSVNHQQQPNYSGGPFYPQQQPHPPAVGNFMYPVGLPVGPTVGFNPDVLSRIPYPVSLSYDGHQGGNDVGVVPAASYPVSSPPPGSSSAVGNGLQLPKHQQQQLAVTTEKRNFRLFSSIMHYKYEAYSLSI